MGTKPIEVLDDSGFSALKAGEYLVEGILPAGREVVLTAGYSSGKTALALDIAVHVALGRDWWGRKVRRGHVLYLVMEGQVGAAERYRRIKARLGVDTAPIYFILQSMSLMEAALPERVIEGLSANGFPTSGYELIVADTWSRLGGGSEENSNDDAVLRSQVLSQLALRLGDPTRLVLHHPAKGGAASRGASALENGADAVLRLHRPHNSDWVTISSPKMRDDESFRPFIFRLERAQVTEVMWAASKPSEFRSSEILSEAETHALEGLRSMCDETMSGGGQARPIEWEAATGLKGGSMDRIRRRLIDLGYVSTCGASNRNRSYAITPEGRRVLDASA